MAIMKFSKAMAMINAFLFIAFIDAQRETILYSTFNASFDVWTNIGGTIKDYNSCPSGASCLRLNNEQEVYIKGISTEGYHSIEFSYSVQQDLSEADEFCQVWIKAPNINNGDWAVEESVQSGGFTSHRLIAFDAYYGVEDSEISLSLFSTGRCFYNDALLTGISITQSPSANPSDQPAGQPSKSPSDSTKIPSVTPSISPTNDPTCGPTVEPTVNPTPKSGQVLTFESITTTQAKDTRFSNSMKGLDNTPMPTIIAIASSIILCFSCIIFGMCIFIKKREMKNTLEQVEISSIDSMNSPSNNGCEDINDVNQNDDESDSDSNGMYETQTATKQSIGIDDENEMRTPSTIEDSDEVEIGYTNEGHNDKSIIPTPVTPDFADV